MWGGEQIQIKLNWLRAQNSKLIHKICEMQRNKKKCVFKFKKHENEV